MIEPPRAPWLMGALLGIAALIAAPKPAAPAQTPARPVVRTAAMRRVVDEAVVRSVVSRRARGRTEVRVAGVGLRSYRLSEPFRVQGRWRFFLTVDDARLAPLVPSKPRATGSVSRIVTEQKRRSVRVMIESTAYGDYGFTLAADTLVVWMTEGRMQADARR